MSPLILFWHRRDLRLSDNIGLAQARLETPAVVGVFCLDRNLLERADVAPVRVTYLIGCLQKLQQSYAEQGSQLLILQGEPSQEIPKLATALKAKAVFWNWDVEPYATSRDQAVSEALKQAGIEVKNFWDQLLHSPDEIRTGTGQRYTVYTPFWKNWITRKKAEPVPALEGFVGLSELEQQAAQQAGIIPLPTAKDLGFIWHSLLVIDPGEKAAQDQLETFCNQAIYEYEEQRNFPAVPGTSQLSAALKFGVIGIRTVWQATLNAMLNCQREEMRLHVQSWQQELAWREFYQHVLYHFPELAAGAYREPFKTFPWDNKPEHFQAWCEGKTGYPIVDAAMRQLKETGWMHNRCRMIVASFLTKDLIINWQWGEKYFMQMLIDGDLSANNGGWQWSASSGMDAKPLRIFNPFSQTQKFDPKGEYIRQWVPELRSANLEFLLTGKITPLERSALGYVQPIVDHTVQQRKFKQLHQQQKQVSIE